ILGGSLSRPVPPPAISACSPRRFVHGAARSAVPRCRPMMPSHVSRTGGLMNGPQRRPSRSLQPGRAVAGRAIVAQDEIGDAGGHFGAKSRAVEHAVMADAGLHVMRLAVGRYVDAERV